MLLGSAELASARGGARVQFESRPGTAAAGAVRPFSAPSTDHRAVCKGSDQLFWTQSQEPGRGRPALGSLPIGQPPPWVSQPQHDPIFPSARQQSNRMSASSTLLIAPGTAPTGASRGACRGNRLTTRDGGAERGASRSTDSASSVQTARISTLRLATASPMERAEKARSLGSGIMGRQVVSLVPPPSPSVVPAPPPVNPLPPRSPMMRSPAIGSSRSSASSSRPSTQLSTQGRAIAPSSHPSSARG